MFIHDLTPLEIAMEEVDHTTGFVATYVSASAFGCIGGKLRIDSRTRSDNLFLIRDFCVLSIPGLLHSLNLFQSTPCQLGSSRMKGMGINVTWFAPP